MALPHGDESLETLKIPKYLNGDDFETGLLISPQTCGLFNSRRKNLLITEGPKYGMVVALNVGTKEMAATGEGGHSIQRGAVA